MSPTALQQFRRVEVSGWDSEQNVFVEATTLRPEAYGLAWVRLRQPVREGELVYIRLFDAAPSGGQLPTAYEVRVLGRRGSSGYREVLVWRRTCSQPPVSPTAEDVTPITVIS